MYNVLPASRWVYNSFAIFLQKKLSSNNSTTLLFIKGYRKYKNKLFKKIKIPHSLWKSLKRQSKRVKKTQKFNYHAKTNRSNGTTQNSINKAVNLQYNQSLKKRLLKKHLRNKYKLKKKNPSIELKIRYLRWLNRNNKNYKYTNFIKNNTTSSRVTLLFSVLIYLNKNNAKKRSVTITKKKIKNRSQQRVKIVHVFKPTSKKYNNKIKKLPILTNKINTKTKGLNTISTTNANLCLLTNKLIKYKQVYLTNIKLDGKKNNTNLDLLYNNPQFKNKIYNYMFNNFNNELFSAGSLPINYISSVPEMLLKTFKLTKKNQYAHFEINKLINDQSYDKDIYGNNSFVYNSMFFKKSIYNSYTNFLPLFLFKNKIDKHRYNATNLTELKTRLYYYNINAHSTTKYKTLFAHYLLTFLEKYIQKKLWVRINATDPINLFWKNYINFFLKKYMYNYRKFNKLIAVRELLEIVWITLKTHDLQILLSFLKKKIENSHFKKHKKILSIFFDILRKNKQLFDLLRVKGFFFDIRGKVGVSGNAKKRHHSFSIGKITTTSQNIGSYFQQISVWTPTGQMGITCIIQY